MLSPLRASVASLVRSYSSCAKQLAVCIVGSGPAGFYTAHQLLKLYGEDVKIDILDRLPTPFGLVRTGVAPDHEDTKNVTNQFTRIAQDPRVNFFGNVNVGRDITLDEIRKLYNAVVLAYGAESDRKLNIPGENSHGVHAAREFVWWYNGHPDQRDLPVDLSRVESVAVCGIGNVALDCARILLRPVSELASTDIARHALKQLQHSKVRQVQLCARRGPVQAACTAKELKELVSMPSIAVHAQPSQLAVSEADQAQMKATRLKRRIYELISNAAVAEKPGASRDLFFQFYRNPAEIIADADNQVQAIRVEKTQLVADPVRGTVAVGTGEYEEYPVQLVLKSIGYKSLPLPGVPFDDRQGVVPNAAGRVLTGVGAAADSTVPGLYVCGWLKRGPTGIIGTNLTDAEETVASMAQDYAMISQAPTAAAGGAGLQQLLQSRSVAVVDYAAWEQLNAHEVNQGQQQGSVRVKCAAWDELLRAAGMALPHVQAM
ncbi:hypothetical protein OEZ85_012135 [Tetradesmus obliquus]|uniref:NADPH:adrenodoxin oxidoreductase, mitochondrial n=1 Tax=Tetradesmus obliquus TaxID=3088 RepID=A0ABY8TSF6_TETOB|nr:hypothetical protein OEZ85_012135 [Tetradesmus obliquus]